MNDTFIEVTSIRHDKKLMLNTRHIIAVMPSRIGCEIEVIENEGRPLAVTEDYNKIKKKLEEMKCFLSV